MTARLPALALVIYLISAACATGKAPDRVQVAAGIAKRTGVDPAGLPVPGKEWAVPPGSRLDDGLEIDEAVSIALWNNPDFQVALSSLGLSRADVIEAGLIKNPVFSLLFPWGPKQLEFTATFVVDQLWQRPKRIADAQLNAEAVAEQLVASGLRLVADTRLAFFEVLLTERRLQLAVEQTGLASQAAKLAGGQLAAGEISEFEAGLARTFALRLETLRLSLLTSRDLAMLRLRAVLGMGVDAPTIRLTAPSIITDDTCSSAPDLFRTALAARPDVRAAELQIEAAGARAGLERARIVSLTASLDANAKGSQGFEMGPGLAVEVPIFSQNQGRIARATAELEQASRRYIAVQAAISTEIASALVGVVEAKNTASLLGGDVGAALAKQRKQAEGLYEAGEISMLALIDTRQRLLEVEAVQVGALFGVNRAIVRLEQAVGRACGAR